MKSFSQLNLKSEIINVLDSLKLKETFEVQEKVIALAIRGKNIVFTSRTGSGKTLAFTIGFLGKINKKFGIQMVVLVPTRELCIQVGKEILRVCEPLGINVGMLYGGREISSDYKTTNKKNQIIVGTPGRLIQHINNKQIKVGDVKLLVFDESDQMFDDGFFDDCLYVRTRASNDAQLILSSATITEKVRNFMNEVIVDYEFLNVGSQIPKNILQEKLFCSMSDKNDVLLKLLSENKFDKVLVFCNTKIKCDLIAKFLYDNKFRVRAINSNLAQTQRLKHLDLFKSDRLHVLVATDVAARGLQINDVDLVVNYDVPTRTEFYIHRIGRTGRTDKKGHSITFVCPEDVNRFEHIESLFELNVKDIS
ncbi:MAG: DEAD/DEAH box helicase [Nanoarchaeota archaeon]|nr:DEAD/DEAH box helicase [Nanoarchaeota archaeon]MBU1269368.1 DEAD/DEAH box helicase [Nanoarchaeota archaeon]MBU1604897.1 DEAD/DEAH box helicase [Nanoarchaeota archaeon]MBU2442682.1 DEAD/DEAH box helicase [Nanoarchaeota archaeon]